MNTPRSDRLQQWYENFSPRAAKYINEWGWFRQRAFWVYGIVIFVMSSIYLAYVPAVPDRNAQAELYGGAVGVAIVNAIEWLTLPYLFLLGAEYIIRRANLSPSQSQVARISAAFVALLGALIMIVLLPPSLELVVK